MVKKIDNIYDTCFECYKTKHGRKPDEYEWWKHVSIPLRVIVTIPSLILIILFFKYGWIETYGLIGSFIIIAIPFGTLFLISEYFNKKKVKR